MDLRIAVIPGDGIGPEVMEAALAVLAAVERRVGGFRLVYDRIDGSAARYRDTGIAFTDDEFRRSEAADAILFGAMGLPDVRYADGTEIAPHLDMRVNFGLYASLRPVRAFPNAPGPLRDPRAQTLDLVIVRECTEGLFASRGVGTVDEDDRVARETLVITRDTSERLFEAAFRLAGRRRERRGTPGRVTCVDKANVFVAMAFFRRIFDEVARRHPDVAAAHHYVDAAALDLVRRPWDFDVMVMENMYGDILSDLGAALVGGMGMAPSAEIGDSRGLFQPAHGSAPDIAGQGIANPTAMILSAAMMLDWLGERAGDARLAEGAGLIDSAMERAFADGRILPREFGGRDGTTDIARVVAGLVGGGPA